MKTNTTNQTGRRAQEQSEQSSAGRKKWNLFIGAEPYGFVHAASEAEALAQVAAFNRPFRAVQAPEQASTGRPTASRRKGQADPSHKGVGS